MDYIIFQLTYNKSWLNPIEKLNLDENYHHYIDMILHDLLNKHSYIINKIIEDIITQEIIKRPKADLRTVLLIRTQIKNNFIENIKTIANNMAKDIFNGDLYNDSMYDD